MGEETRPYAAKGGVVPSWGVRGLDSGRHSASGGRRWRRRLPLSVRSLGSIGGRAKSCRFPACEGRQGAREQQDPTRNQQNGNPQSGSSVIEHDGGTFHCCTFRTQRTALPELATRRGQKTEAVAAD